MKSNMSALRVGTRVAVDTEGKSFRLLGVIHSVDKGVVTIHLDDDQPVADSPTGSGVDLFVEDDGEFSQLEMEVLDTRAASSLIRLVARRVLKGPELRAEERIGMEHPLLWSSLDAGGHLTEQRRGVTRDISMSGISFETLNSPPQNGELVAISGMDPDHDGAVIALVVGVDDAPSKRRRHVVRCVLQRVDEQSRVHLAELISTQTIGPEAVKKSMKTVDQSS